MRMRLGRVAGLVVGLAATATAWADPRPWTFVYDTYPEGKGTLEYEQWVTYEGHKDEDHGSDEFRFRHEFEYGVTDNFDLSLYVADWNYEDSDERTGTQYEHSAVEGIYYFSNPVTDAVGAAFYTEVQFGESDLALENKLLLHKDIGNWSFAYNLIVETEWEDAYNADEGAEIEGELGHAFGVSYAFDTHWRAGGELTVESVFPDWSEYEDTEVYAGPNVGYWTSLPNSDSEFWLTVTPMFQLSSVGEEPDFVVRMIAGWVF